MVLLMGRYWGASRKFECTKSTIKEFEEKSGEDEYSNLIVKYKSLKEISEINKFKRNNKDIQSSVNESSYKDVEMHNLRLKIQ